MKLLGIDTGGTFTDFVYYADETLRTHKVLSTPQAPGQAILQGICDLNITLSAELQIIHGSTVATNALLEGKGADTVYVTNRGFKDVLTIGRQARKGLYDLSPAGFKPPIPRSHCLETGGRINAQAAVLEPLTEADIDRLNAQVAQLNPQAVAINLLFSYLDARFEEQLAAAMPNTLFVSCSSKILPMYREYERGITTWLNAYVGPLMQGYLQRLQTQLGAARLSIMRSSGDTCVAAQAGQEAVHLLLSGPAGGLTAGHYLSQQLGEKHCLTFDMGGTSTDVALIDGPLELTGEASVGGYPVGVPMVNIHTIGAGGGSIAYMDAGGLLQVGPESAGASPGPACYGRGGSHATVTDANLLLGRIPKGVRFGKTVMPDIARAEAVISTLTKQLGLASNEEMALGIIRIANEHMARALRVISLERGIDAREFSLMAFGGAGGLHVCELAEQLGMTCAVVPNQAGVLSAFGMLVAEPGRQLTQTLDCPLNSVDKTEIEQALSVLGERAKSALLAEGHDLKYMDIHESLDLCYRGQASYLNLPWTGKAGLETMFHEMHQTRYGYQLQTPVHIVNARLGARITGHKPLRLQVESTSNPDRLNANQYLLRSQLEAGQVIEGEVSICSPDATLWLAPGWLAHTDENGHIRLNKKQ